MMSHMGQLKYGRKPSKVKFCKMLVKRQGLSFNFPVARSISNTRVSNTITPNKTFSKTFDTQTLKEASFFPILIHTIPIFNFI
jgi:hypothetical protein